MVRDVCANIIYYHYITLFNNKLVYKLINEIIYDSTKYSIKYFPLWPDLARPRCNVSRRSLKNTRTSWSSWFEISPYFKQFVLKLRPKWENSHQCSSIRTPIHPWTIWLTRIENGGPAESRGRLLKHVWKTAELAPRLFNELCSNKSPYKIFQFKSVVLTMTSFFLTWQWLYIHSRQLICPHRVTIMRRPDTPNAHSFFNGIALMSCDHSNIFWRFHMHIANNGNWWWVKHALFSAQQNASSFPIQDKEELDVKRHERKNAPPCHHSNKEVAEKQQDTCTWLCSYLLHKWHHFLFLTDLNSVHIVVFPREKIWLSQPYQLFFTKGWT